MIQTFFLSVFIGIHRWFKKFLLRASVVNNLAGKTRKCGISMKEDAKKSDLFFILRASR